MGLNIVRTGQREWFLDVRIRLNGKEQRKRETFYGTQVQAEERYLQLKKELRGQTKVYEQCGQQFIQTMGEALNIYRSVKGGIPKKELGRFIRLTCDLGSASMVSLPTKLDEYLSMLRLERSKKTRKPLSNGSLNKLLIMIKAALNLAVRMGRLERNPLSPGCFPMFKQVPRDRCLSPGECERLLTIIRRESPHIEAIVKFALSVPCRRAELVRMRREDLDLPNMAIRVRNGTTKNNEGCWKPIPPVLAPYFASIPEDCPWLFYRTRGGHFLPLGDFKKAWGRCKRLAGIEDFRFHDTRHVSATALLDNGTPEQVVMVVAGWKTNMLRTYYHRSSKRALGLVNFSPGGGRKVDAIRVEHKENGEI